MASLALHLKSHHHKPSQTLLKSTPSFTHFFSSSSSSDNNNSSNNNNNNDDNGEKQYPFSGYFKDIKSKLKQHEQQRQQQQSPGFNKPSPFNFTSQDSSNPSKKPESFEEIKKNLSEFRRRSSPDIPSSPQQQQQQIGLFQNVRNRSVGNPNSAAVNVQSKGGNLSFDAIRESLRQMKGAVGEKGIGNSNMSDKMSLNNYKKSLKLQQPTTMAASAPGAKVIGGSFENLPESVFGKEMREKERKEQGGSAGAGSGGKSALDIQFLKSYNYDELGDKLRELRPEMKEKNGGEGSWFSLSELNERVKKLKEIEEKQLDGDKIAGPVYGELRKSLQTLRDENENKSKPVSINMLPSSSFTQSPPKDHLIEKYFHPDNMSAEEKLKIELKKVREEFKMHESDCGSTRVQIAQLTTEILHLSSVLHKKDKHSRKGLQAKVQQRKKLLKYLRRTDWESYIFVLSKLGLRDNPDYKS